MSPCEPKLPVMRVVEQQSECATAGTNAAYFGYQCWIRPLVDHDDLRIGESCFMVEAGTINLRREVPENAWRNR
jgi:hypothetical protein